MIGIYDASMTTEADESLNPYASPRIEGGYTPNMAQDGYDGLWRQRDVLVMHRDAKLPAICLKSGEPATEWLPRHLQWAPPWIGWALFFALPVYIVLSMFMTRRALVLIGVSRDWAIRRRLRMLIAVGIIAAGAIVGIGGAFIAKLGTEYEVAFMLLPLGVFISLLIGLGYGEYACRLVWPQRISDQFIWLKGVHPDFLKRLPEWPEDAV
jgi:hypothetical protein